MIPERASLRGLHLIAIWMFAVVQPLLDLIGRFPTFLVAHRTEPADITVLLAVLVIAVPLSLFALTRLLGLLHRRVEETAYLTLVGVGFGLVALQIVLRLPIQTGGAAVAGAVCAALAAAWGYWKLSGVRSLTTVLSVGIVVFPVFFLTAPGMRSVVRPKDTPLDRAPEVASKTPVVFVIFDEFPEVALIGEKGTIDSGRFPNIAALSRDGLWFRNAFTVSEFTIQAVPSILTGRYVPFDLLPTAADHPESIFTLLGGAYRVQALEPLTQLCPSSVCSTEGGMMSAERIGRFRSTLEDLSIVYLHLIAPRAWAGYLPPVSDSWAGFGKASEPLPTKDEKDFSESWKERWDAGIRADKFGAFKSFLDRVDHKDRALYVLHTLLPHSPYCFLPSGHRYDLEAHVEGLDLRNDLWIENESVVAEAEKRHLLQVGFVDHLVGLVVDRLKQVGIYDESLVVVTADHGSSFVAGSRRRNLTDDNAGDILPIPLLVKLPGGHGGRIIDRPVETIDILPTVAEVLGIDIPWSVDGRSLLHDDHPREAIQVMVRGNHKGATYFPVAGLIQARNASVSKRLTLWGNGDWDQVLRVGPRPNLVGEREEDLRVVGKTSGVSVLIPERFQDVELDRTFLPAMVRGLVEGTGSEDPPVELAIALNGTVRATTKSYRSDKGSEGIWEAVLGDSALRPGDNSLDVYVINGSSAPPTVLRAWPNGSKAQRRNLLLQEAAPLWGVVQDGFYEQHRRGEGIVRWTNGRARLVVPIEPSTPPDALYVGIESTGPLHSAFRILVDGCELASEEHPPRQWSKTLDLSGCSATGDRLTIELLSDTFIPAETIEGSHSHRTAGLLVDEIALLHDGGQ